MRGKWLLVAALGLLMAQVVGAQRLHLPSQNSTAGAVASITVTKAEATQAGSLLVVVEMDRNTTGTHTFKDVNGGRTFKIVGTKTGAAGSVSLFYVANTTVVQANQFSVSCSPACQDPYISVTEYANAQAVLDGPVVAGSDQNLNQSPQTISATIPLQTTQTADLLVGGIEDNCGIATTQSCALTAGAGWAITTGKNAPGGVQDRVAGAAGAYQCTGQLKDALFKVQIACVAFLPATQGPPPPPPTQRAVTLTCHYDTGAPCVAHITEYLVTADSNGVQTKTGQAAWDFVNGSASITAPIANTGTYEYDFTQNAVPVFPSYTLQAGAFQSFLLQLQQGVVFNVTVSAATGMLVGTTAGGITWQ